jgi:hypothetical protein
MTGSFLNDELELMSYIEILPQYMLGGTERNAKEIKKEHLWPVSRHYPVFLWMKETQSSPSVYQIHVMYF